MPWRGLAMATDWTASIDPCWRHPCNTPFGVRRGGTRNDAKFIADLRAAIEAAPKRDSRTDVAGYLDEVYLHRIIDGAFHLIDNAAKSDATMNLITRRRSSCRQGSA